MKWTNIKIILGALTTCAGVLTALGQPTITSFRLSGAGQTVWDQPPNACQREKN